MVQYHDCRQFLLCNFCQCSIQLTTAKSWWQVLCGVWHSGALRSGGSQAQRGPGLTADIDTLLSTRQNPHESAMGLPPHSSRGFAGGHVWGDFFLGLFPKINSGVLSSIDIGLLRASLFHCIHTNYQSFSTFLKLHQALKYIKYLMYDDDQLVLLT